MLKDEQMINNDFFESWSSNMAYVLGFVVADGCVMKRKDRKNSFIFNITTKDRNHLENIQKGMRSKYKIGLKNGEGSKEKNISFVQITNRKVCLDLIGFVRRTGTFNHGSVATYIQKLKPKVPYIFLIVSEENNTNVSLIQPLPECVKFKCNFAKQQIKEILLNYQEAQRPKETTQQQPIN